jgi:hypothetical protein
MYYTDTQGVKDTWRDHVQTIKEQFSQHSWLPAGVAAIMIAWIALIVMGLQQTITTSPLLPDTTAQVSNPATNLSVSDSSNVSNRQSGTMNVGVATPPTMTMGSSSWAIASNNTSQTSTTSSMIDSDEIGGKGGDTTSGNGSGGDSGTDTTPPTDTTTPIDPGTTPPVTVDTGSGDDGTTIDVGVTVPETPITPEVPVDVDVNLPIDTGGLL